MKFIHLLSLLTSSINAVRNTRLWCVVFIYHGLWSVAIANNTEASVQETYIQTLKQCEQQFAPAQCQRNATLKYESDRHTLKQQAIVQAQEERILKAQQKATRPTLSQQQKAPEPFSVRPTLQRSLPKPNAIVLNKPVLLAPKKYSTKTNRALINKIKTKPAIDLAQRQAQSNQKRTQRLAKNAQRREQGFIVDTVAAP